MQKINTMQTSRKNLFQGQLTIGVDLGDRSSAYCVLNEAGEIVLEHKLATTPEAMKQVFGSMRRCRMAMETGTHSLLTGTGFLMEDVMRLLAHHKA
jgi:transposase